MLSSRTGFIIILDALNYLRTRKWYMVEKVKVVYTIRIEHGNTSAAQIERARVYGAGRDA